MTDSNNTDKEYSRRDFLKLVSSSAVAAAGETPAGKTVLKLAAAAAPPIISTENINNLNYLLSFSPFILPYNDPVREAYAQGIEILNTNPQEMPT